MGLFKFTINVEAPSFEEGDIVTGITLTANHILVLVDASSGAVTITLPAAEDNEGTVYIFKKIDSSGNSVTIDGNGSETIDGEQSVVLNLQYQYVTVACDGDEWFIIGGEYVKMEDLLGHLVDEQGEINKILQNIETHLSLGSDEELDKEED